MGARGQSLARSKEFLEVSKKFATDLEYGEAMDCCHYMAENIPDIMYDKFLCRVMSAATNKTN